MRTMGVREYATAMAETGMPCKLPGINHVVGSTILRRRPITRKLAVRLRTMAEIGLMLCNFRADRRRMAQNRIAAASRKRNR